MSPAIITTILGLLLVIFGIWVGDNANLLPIDASTNATIYDQLFSVLLSIGTILFFGMLGLVLYSLIRFRRKPGQEGDGSAIEDNLPLEIFWTIVPTVVILFVGLYSYDIYDRMGGMQQLDLSGHNHQGQETMVEEERIWGGIGSGSVEDKSKSSLESIPIDVTAMQFAFLFHYPEGDFISGELHVPVGKPISMRMESKDVIHAFWVPEFRIKQDIIPGQPTILSFTAQKEGKYPIICAELCGPYHGGMRSNVIVEDTSSYTDWLLKNAKNTIT